MSANIIVLFSLRKLNQEPGEMFPVKKQPETDTKDPQANQPEYEVDREDQELEE